MRSTIRYKLLIPIVMGALLLSSLIISRSGTVQSGSIPTGIPTPAGSGVALIGSEVSPTVSLSPQTRPTSTPSPTLEPSRLPTVPVANVPRIGDTSDTNHVKVEVSADPGEYQGSCRDPLEFTFTATITLSKAGTIIYKWVRSDGVETSSPQTVTFSESGTKTVSASWQPTFSSLEFSGWQKMKILSPIETESNQSSFSILCSL